MHKWSCERYGAIPSSDTQNYHIEMKRNIFHKEPITEVQQGCIFSGAIADGYKDCNVHGLIITPRCDIAQKKVTTIHYLPVVKFSDWKERDLVTIYRFEQCKKKLADLEQRFNANNVPASLLNPQYKMSKEELAKLLDGEKAKLIEPLCEYWELFDDESCIKNISNWKNYDNRLSELASGRNERFLLLESWEEDKDEYYVINLTEVRHIKAETAYSLLKSIRATTIDTTKDEMMETTDKNVMFGIKTSLTSPYIEYVCQKFSGAFFRIGIEDWPCDMKQELKTK